MILKLQEIEAYELPKLLWDISKWNTLDVDYHPPKIERLWTQLEENRLLLHIIHPCKTEDALYHPHPWPSAMHIVSGKYEMGVGFKEEGNLTVKQIASFDLEGDNYYEMLEPRGWHG